MTKLDAPVTLEEMVQGANRLTGCKLCNGIRFKRCPACGEAVNSFPDHRVGPKPQMYPRISDWREVNGEPEQNVPDRRLQP